MSTFIVRLFGSLQIANGRLPASRYGRTLLAYLLLHPGYPHGRPQLATLLAPEWSEARGRCNCKGNLNHALFSVSSPLFFEPRVTKKNERHCQMTMPLAEEKKVAWFSACGWD